MKAVIIGSGIGGMATAIRLASLGFETEVFEQNSFYGGKIDSKQIGAYRFDRGPEMISRVTMNKGMKARRVLVMKKELSFGIV